MQKQLLNNKPSNALPIGIMDSGVGGLSVFNHVRRLLPHESVLYVADSLHAPYGDKSAAEITQRCFAIADFLIEQGVKALVVACNTATAAAIQQMRNHYQLPIIGMEPAVKPAVKASRNGIIGVLATVGTIKSAQYAALLANYGEGVTVLAQGCVGLVECVEQGELTQASTGALLKQYLTPLLEGGADTIVLGCTHYPFLRPRIQSIVGDDVTVIDTGEAVSLQLQATLKAQGLLLSEPSGGITQCWTNSSRTDADLIIQRLALDDVKVNRLPSAI